MEIHKCSIITTRAADDSHFAIEQFRETKERPGKLVVTEYRAEETVCKMDSDLMLESSQWLDLQKGTVSGLAQHSIVSPC